MSDKEIMLNQKIWAVAGANQNCIKFGNKIYRKLKEKGYEVYPINPMYDNVEGDACYKDMTSMAKIPDVLNIVVSPERAVPLIKEAASLGVKYIWFQPHTYNDEVLQITRELGIIAVKDCVLVALP
ncbi:MAG: CoA-binding protein [Solirubrobacterales bacterium]